MRKYVYTKARPESALLCVAADDFNPSDVRVPRDVARRMKGKSLFEARSELFGLFAYVKSKNKTEAEFMLVQLQAMARKK